MSAVFPRPQAGSPLAVVNSSDNSFEQQLTCDAARYQKEHTSDIIDIVDIVDIVDKRYKKRGCTGV